MSDVLQDKLDISVVIPTHNRSDALDLTLLNLAKQDFGGRWEVIVVDNNSTEDLSKVINRRRDEFSVAFRLIEEKKPGPAAARNTGARIADGEYILFLDNDILVNADFLSRHMRRLRENPGAWIVGQVMNLPEFNQTAFGQYRNSLFPPIPFNSPMQETVGITGQATSLPSEDFRKLEGFDERFFVASGEDRDFALRASKAGIKVLLDPTIISLHNDWAGASIRDYCRRQRLYTQTEPLFAAKYGLRNPRLELSVRNSPPNLKRDGFKLAMSKLAKRLAGSDAGQAVLIRVCESLERLVPDTLILWRLYRAAIAGAIYRGYQEGISKLAEADTD